MSVHEGSILIFSAFLSALLDSLIGDKLQGKFQTKSGKIIEHMQLNTYLAKTNPYLQFDLEVL